MRLLFDVGEAASEGDDELASNAFTGVSEGVGARRWPPASSSCAEKLAWVSVGSSSCAKKLAW
eukprot:2500517-Pyramimonas_sp.AAC.1